MVQIIPFTAKGLEQIRKEKEKLLVIRKPAVESLRIAREMGDLSENGAYKAARAELSSIDARLRHITKLIRFGRLADKPISGMIGIGSMVKLSLNGKSLEYEIVGSFESDPAKCKISHVSPIGKMLMGRNSGDKIVVRTPNGQVIYQILSVK